MWCATTNIGPSLCASTEDICKRMMTKFGGGMCGAEYRAACFTSRAEGDLDAAGWCFRTVDECHAMMKSWTDPIVRGCFVMREAGAPARTAVATAAPAEPPNRLGWWCAELYGGDLGVCYGEEYLCELHRERGKVDDQRFGPCLRTMFVACFDFRGERGANGQACSSTMAKCRSLRDGMLGTSMPPLSECTVVE
jgi:hypothetical protein